jgi:dihydropteroate synthase
LISQIVNLSNKKSLANFKEKFNLGEEFYEGMFGLEFRNIPADVFSQIEKLNDSKQNNIITCKNDLFVLGSLNEIANKIGQLCLPNEIESEILKAINKYLSCDKISYAIGNKVFDFNFSYVMGILNVTPDSFSDGGNFTDKKKAVNYALKMIELGADIIDIGGESTRPGSEPVSETEEIDRVLPVINELLSAKPDAVISIDTTKCRVAKEALNAGALIVNDISGGIFEPEMFKVVSERDATLILMHMRGKPKSMQESPEYEEVVSEVYDFLVNQSNKASKIGIQKIIIDPGIGFGKNIEHNLTLINRLEDFKSLGFPIMIGLSRKSFIGKILNLPVEERDDVTNSLNSIALCKGARIIRTHNVEKAVQTCRIFNRLITN